MSVAVQFTCATLWPGRCIGRSWLLCLDLDFPIGVTDHPLPGRAATAYLPRPIFAISINRPSASPFRSRLNCLWFISIVRTRTPLFPTLRSLDVGGRIGENADRVWSRRSCSPLRLPLSYTVLDGIRVVDACGRRRAAPRRHRRAAPIVGRLAGS